MKPPADRQLDLQGAGSDVPLPPPLDCGVRWRTVFVVATLLGVLSSAMAYQLSSSTGRAQEYFRSLVILNFAYWYLWALATPAIVWLSQHFRFERQNLLRALAVHVPTVGIFSIAHIAAMQGVRWWLLSDGDRPFFWLMEVRRAVMQTFDWQMMTYWAIVGISHSVLYYRESRDRAVRASQLETMLVEARLNTLQQQLQPHFLFNTLHAISTLMHRDVDAADRTLTRLSDLLRMTLDNLGQHEVHVKTELEFLAKYLEIEQTRFADRLVVHYDVQPETLDARVPTLLLQPLVENAIKHGISKKAGPGHIGVTVRRERDKLWIEVRDDGAGLSESALGALQKGIGVSTTRARLLHRYGADYRFEFHRLPQGLAVVIAIPWRTDAPAATTPHGVEEPHDRTGASLQPARVN
jgi:signal transduction histidine kinase